MTKEELVIRLLILNPLAKLSVWDLEGDYFGETEAVIRCGYRIDWRNTESCPLEDQIYAVNDEQINIYKENKINDNLIRKYENDLQMKMLYKLEKQTNPDLSYLDFLKSAENFNVNE